MNIVASEMGAAANWRFRAAHRSAIRRRKLFWTNLERHRGIVVDTIPIAAPGTGSSDIERAVTADGARIFDVVQCLEYVAISQAPNLTGLYLDIPPAATG